VGEFCKKMKSTADALRDLGCGQAEGTQQKPNESG
jgi:hypothetical protein